MNVIAIIPARYASTRLDGKPLADICGKTMIERVYARAKAARLVNDVVVATDDRRIFDAVKAFGGTVIMTSARHASGTDRIAEAAGKFDADIIVNVQGDEPLLEPSTIDAAIGPMLADAALSICTLKTRILDEREMNDPHAVKVVTDRNGFALYFSRSVLPYSKEAFLKRPTPSYKHIGLYVYRKAALLEFAALPQTSLEVSESLEQLRAIENGIRIKVVETNESPVSVDTPEDLMRVRELVALTEKGR